jgi:hypothetical protein
MAAAAGLYRVLQANLNHSARAQDLLCQHLAEWSIEMAVVTEPYLVQQRNNWFGDRDGLVAVIGASDPLALPMTLVESGEGFVAVRWGETTVVGVYFSPNRGLAEFEGLLRRVGAVVERSRGGPVVVGGDFNAKSVEWGSSAMNGRGRALGEWALELGLCVLNRGAVNTCVRHNGGSIVDLTFGCPRASCLVSNWEVMEGEEMLSDHRYIRSTSPTPPLAVRGRRLRAKEEAGCRAAGRSGNWILIG